MTDPRWFLDQLAEEGRRMVAAARPDGLDQPAPPCPDMTVREVLRHTGSMYRLVTRWVRDGRRPGDWEQSPQDGEGVLAWLRTGLEELLAELSERDVNESCATWWPWDRTVGFWYRRMAHETVVHRADVQLAYDKADPVDAELATDGIDEVLTLWLATRLGSNVGGDGRITEVRAGERFWRVSPHASHIDYPTEEATPDVTVRGTPSDLYLWLWGRVPESHVTFTGDATAARKLRGVLRNATQ